ncbi:MAG: hypothetical protein GOV15_00710 [Candidatus Diapherotrites archaeon]|nr:hypothetical protein [Candidatus Diapherotrites archaeon]
MTKRKHKSKTGFSEEDKELTVYLLFFLVGAIMGMALLAVNIGTGIGITTPEMVNRTLPFVVLSLIGLGAIALIKNE